MLLLAVSAHAAVDVTACGQEVPRGQVGVLVADLDCGWPTDELTYGVRLAKGATLNLNGHTITGPRFGVLCPEACKVVGPGTIQNAYYGVWAFDSKRSRADLTDVTLMQNLGGIAAIRGRLINVTASDNFLATQVLKLRASNLLVTGCSAEATYCLQTGSAVIDGLQVTGNPSPNAVVFATGTLKLRNATITGNASPVGIRSDKRVTLIDSSVTGHHAADIWTGAPPRLVNSTCGTSAGPTIADPSWGVCAND